MRRSAFPLGGAAAFLVVIAVPAFAQQSDCSGFKWSVDAEAAAFGSEGLPAVASGTQLPTQLEAAALTLAKQDGVSFATPPTRKPKHDPAYAGVFSLPPITAPGAYQVTISDEAWIDVIQDGKLLKQTGYTGSHTCAAVRKSVRFNLANGPATIEISDAPKDTLKLEVLPQTQ